MTNERRRPPHRPRGPKPEQATVIDFASRKRLGEEEIAQRAGEDAAQPLTDEDLLKVAHERQVFTWPDMMARAKALTGEALDTDVLRLLDARYHFSGDAIAYEDSALRTGMDHLTAAHREVRHTNEQHHLCSVDYNALAVAVLQFLRGNNYVEQMLGDRVPEPLRKNDHWERVMRKFRITPQMRDDTYAVLALIGRHDRPALNPLVIRPDLLTFLRAITAERAIQWAIGLTPADIDELAGQINSLAISPLVDWHLIQRGEAYFTSDQPSQAEQTLRQLDQQAGKSCLTRHEIRALITAYHTGRR
ncbi:MAG: hypothetical protein ACD_43C00172G0003 [uncultured bacterium]|nr:MAG: hypothetical protein ACD_43C00172G0003 [uncultured bacterium]